MKLTIDTEQKTLTCDGRSLSLYSDTLKQESWTAGSRKVNCKVGALEEDGSLRPVVGSVRAQPASTSAKPSK